jgi:D-alanyl-D-alanine carboxypeptidase/D-alanyl-D-alanine-endopeptidase (penicillin-binding protein 4)
VLRTALSGTQPNLHALVPSLPMSGYDGTLHKRYVAGGTQIAAGMVRAKTGSLSGVSSLAGVAADQDGRPLVFALVADRVPAGGLLAAEAALDRIATTLVRCGCR